MIRQITVFQCPTCGCSGTPSTTSAHCETRVQFFKNSACSTSNPAMIGPDQKPGFVVGDTCVTINLDTSQFTPVLYSHDPPYAVDNSCTPHQSTDPEVFPPPVWDFALRACDMPTFGGCSSNQSTCVKLAGGVFDRSVCIYQQADPVACPPERF